MYMLIRLHLTQDAAFTLQILKQTEPPEYPIQLCLYAYLLWIITSSDEKVKQEKKQKTVKVLSLSPSILVTFLHPPS